MFSQKPEMAQEWAAATPSIKALPQKVGKAIAKGKKKKGK